MKVSNRDCARVVQMQAAAGLFEPLLRACMDCHVKGAVPDGDVTAAGERLVPLSRLQLGLAVRRGGEMFPLAVLLAAARISLERVIAGGTETASLDGVIRDLGGRCGLSTAGPFLGQQLSDQAPSTHASADRDLSPVLRAAETILSTIASLGLETCHSDRQMLSYEAVKRVSCLSHCT